MADRRLNPQLPSGAVPSTVTNPIRLSLSRAVNPNGRQYDTSRLAKGLQPFIKLAAERRAEKETEAFQQGRQAPIDPEVFAAAKTDEDFERILAKLSRDGQVRAALLPSFQAGLKTSIAERRLRLAQAETDQAILNLETVDEQGFPLPQSEVLSRVTSIADEAIARNIPAGILTDPDVAPLVEEMTSRIREQSSSLAFERAMGQQEDWMTNFVQDTFTDFLSNAAGPLAETEMIGLHKGLDNMVREFRGRGLNDVVTPLVDATLTQVREIQAESVEDAQAFLDGVLSFEVNGRALEDNPAEAAPLIEYQAGLTENKDDLLAREGRRRERTLNDLKAEVNEAYGDALPLLEQGEYEKAEAVMLGAVSENPAFNEDFDGQIGIYVNSLIENSKNTTSADDLRAIQRFTSGSERLPEGWEDGIGQRVSPEDFGKLLAAQANQTAEASTRLTWEANTERIISDAEGTLKTAGLSNSANIDIDNEMSALMAHVRAVMGEQHRQVVEGFPPDEVEHQMQGVVKSVNETVLLPRLAEIQEKIKSIDSDRTQINLLPATPTSENLVEAQRLLDARRGDFSPDQARILQSRIDIGYQDRGQIEADLMRGGEFYTLLENDLALAGLGDKLPEVFKEIRDDFDGFISSLPSASPAAARSAIKQRVADYFNIEEGVSIEDGVLEQQALAAFYATLEEDPYDATVYFENEDALTPDLAKWASRRFRAGSNASLPRSVVNTDPAFAERVRGLPMEQGRALVVPFIVSPDDILEGELVYKGRIKDGVFSTKEETIATYPLEGVDWRITPVANTMDGLYRDLNRYIQSEDIFDFLSKVGYFDLNDIGDDAALNSAIQQFTSDQEKIIKMRRHGTAPRFPN